jgi:hypothetical protein
MRHKRKIIVTQGKESIPQKMQSYKELVEQLNASWDETKRGEAGDVVAIRRLPSEDMVVTMADEKARTSWLANRKWLATLGEGARVKIREFAVIAHGIRVNQVQGTQDERIEQVYKQNPRLQGTVDILRVAFSKRLIQSGCTTRPLIISVAEPEQANSLIDAGLIWHHELHDCEPFNGDCVVTQCFKCYKYRHVGYNCRNIQRCRHCAALGHALNDCLGKEDRTKHQCVNCRGKHQSWARECPERKKQTAAAQEAYIQRPVRYQVGAELPVRTRRTFVFDSAPAPAPAPALGPQASAQASTPKPPPPAPTVEDEAEAGGQWTQVGTRRTTSPPAGPPEKRRRGPGRPLGTMKASNGTKDIREVFSKLYE